MYKTRTRALRMGTQRAKWTLGSTTVVDQTNRVNTVITESLTTQGNFWPPPKALRKADMGNGAFVRISYEASGSGDVNINFSDKVVGTPQEKHCSGVLLPVAPTLPTPLVPSNALLDKYGTDGFNATIPTKPLQQAAVFAGELRQLPSISQTALTVMQSRAKTYRRSYLQHLRKIGKDGADDWLNTQFGWIPFLKDIDSLLTPRVELMKRVSQLERDSGKPVRRRRVLHDTTSVTVLPTVSSGGYGYPTGLSAAQLVLGQGVRHQANTLRERAWFSACYRYYIEPKTTALGIPRAIQMARLIHGLSITPDVLWNLSPWSWLADYGGNIGKVLANLTAFTHDNLVAQYAYVMVETRVTQDIGLLGIKTRGGGTISTFMSTTAICKRRVRGTPYGFGFVGPLNAKQISILVALGLSNGLK